jgi:hypothetical protein
VLLLKDDCIVDWRDVSRAIAAGVLVPLAAVERFRAVEHGNPPTDIYILQYYYYYR